MLQYCILLLPQQQSQVATAMTLPSKLEMLNSFTEKVFQSLLNELHQTHKLESLTYQVITPSSEQEMAYNTLKKKESQLIEGDIYIYIFKIS